MWENIVERAGHRWQYGVCAFHAGYIRLQTHTLRLRNTVCFSTATMIARTRLNITLYMHWLSDECLFRLRWCNFCYINILLLRANYSHVLNYCTKYPLCRTCGCSHSFGSSSCFCMLLTKGLLFPGAEVLQRQWSGVSPGLEMPKISGAVWILYKHCVRHCFICFDGYAWLLSSLQPHRFSLNNSHAHTAAYLTGFVCVKCYRKVM